MLGHPSTNAASLVSLTATSKMASETAKFTLLAQTTTTMLLSKQTQATQAAPPLSSIARTLTQYFFGEITLPSYLQPYGHLLLGFTGGAAAATALYSFLQRNKDDRRKIQLAVFHVVRVLQNLPNLEERMQTPEKLLAMISEEVNYMIGIHLTQSEGAATISQVKRKVEMDFNARLQKEEVMKKRRMDSASVEDEDDALFDRPGEVDVQATEAHVAGDVLGVVIQSPSSSIERNGNTSQELDLSHEEDLDLDLDMTMPDYDSLDQAQVPFSYKKPANERSLPTSPGSDDDSNESSSVLATRPSNPTPRRSRGDAYDIHDTPASQPSRLACPRGNVISYEEDSKSTLQPSNSTPRRDQVSSFEHTDTPRPKIARKANDGPGKDNHNIHFLLLGSFGILLLKTLRRALRTGLQVKSLLESLINSASGWLLELLFFSYRVRDFLFIRLLHWHIRWNPFLEAAAAFSFSFKILVKFATLCNTILCGVYRRAHMW